MKSTFFLKFSSLLIIALLFSGCGWFGGDKNKEQANEASSNTEQTQSTNDDKSNDDDLAKDTTLSNPATVYCLAQGGEFVMNKTLNGNMAGYCKLPSNITCEIWAFYRGECPEGYQKDEPEDKTETDEQATTTKDTIVDDEVLEESLTATSSEKILEKDTLTTNGTKKEPSDTIKTSDNQNFVINIEQGEESGELNMSWKTDLDAPEGFIVMLSGSKDITYPTKYYHKLENQYSHAFTWIDLTPGKTYFFRICTVKGDGCDEYSSVIDGTVAE
ncbi:DUF333 domain-containing protein [Patescibacteria group bacterium]|nr:DUF333 domain-containing protein [Patescibacteria group bacterium]